MAGYTLLRKLFTSGTRVRVLGTLFKEERPLYESEVAFLSMLTRTTVQRELYKLKNMGLLYVRRTKTRTFYDFNKKFVYYTELRSMFRKKH